ncbi:hypothetical protein OG474_10875 [Kribbella sp. NBC_01505]|uniref:hypothetical protein n=1 Tax=Kribbella sp. NBC_01505 TaxID=2903580 RepID=UPI003864EC40
MTRQLRPALAWQLRQGSVLVYVIWFAVAVPLVIVGLLVEPRWVGWFMLAWFVVLVAFTLAMRMADVRRQKAWARAARELGWRISAAGPEVLERWPFPPFDLDPRADVAEVTTGRHRGREFVTGEFRHRVRRRNLGFEFLDLQVDRPLPPMQVLPSGLAPVAAAGLLPLRLDVAGLPGHYDLFNGREDHAQALLHPRAVEVLTGVAPFGFSCEGRRFVAIFPAYRDTTTALAHLDAACDLLDLMPEQLWREGEQWAATRAT